MGMSTEAGKRKRSSGLFDLYSNEPAVVSTLNVGESIRRNRIYLPTDILSSTASSNADYRNQISTRKGQFFDEESSRFPRGFEASPQERRQFSNDIHSTIIEGSKKKKAGCVDIKNGGSGLPIAQKEKTLTAPENIRGCNICGKEDNDSSILLCDGCDDEYHMYCLTPPMAMVPEGDFFCPMCIKKRSISPIQVDAMAALRQPIVSPATEPLEKKKRGRPPKKKITVVMKDPFSQGKILPKEIRLQPRNSFLSKKQKTSFNDASESTLDDAVSKTDSGYTSVYRGVLYRASRKCWSVKINVRGNRYKFGRFKTDEEAAQAYDREAYHEQGVWARLNFPDLIDTYKQQGRDKLAVFAANPGAKESKQERRERKKAAAAFEENAQASVVNDAPSCGPLRSKKKYRGISFSGKKFQSQIYYGGKSVYLGSFSTQFEAAVAYDKAVEKYYNGTRSDLLNFPNGIPVVEEKEVVTNSELAEKPIVSVCKRSDWEIKIDENQKWLQLLTSTKKLNAISKKHVQESTKISDTFTEDVTLDDVSACVESILFAMKSENESHFSNSLKTLDPCSVGRLKAPSIYMDLCFVMKEFNMTSLTNCDDLESKLIAVIQKQKEFQMAIDIDNNESGTLVDCAQSYFPTEVGASSSHLAAKQYCLLRIDEKDSSVYRYGIIFRVGETNCDVCLLHSGEYLTVLNECIVKTQLLETDVCMLEYDGKNSLEATGRTNFQELFAKSFSLEMDVQNRLLSLRKKVQQHEKELIKSTNMLSALVASTEDTHLEFARRERKYNCAEKHARYDVKLLSDLNRTMASVLGNAVQVCIDTMCQCLDSLTERLTEFLVEVTFYAEALANLKEVNLCNDLQIDLEACEYTYYRSELQNLYAERSTVLEILKQVDRNVSALRDLHTQALLLEAFNELLMKTRRTFCEWHDSPFPVMEAKERTPRPHPTEAFNEAVSQALTQEGSFVILEATTAPYQTLVLYHPDCINHRTPLGHPECPDRLRKSLVVLDPLVRKHPHALRVERLTNSASEIAPSDTTLLMVHSATYLDHLRERSVEALTTEGGKPLVFESQHERSTTMVDEKVHENMGGGGAFAASSRAVVGAMDTYVCGDSWNIALIAAGTVCIAVDEVMLGKAKNSVCLIRPPGHHVGRDGCTAGAPSSGFCLLNNVVVGAMHARLHPSIQRVAVIDWDIHHGNGTEELLKGDADAFFASIHLFSGHYFPGTGDDFDGENVVNVALKNEGIGSGSLAFRKGMSEKILPALDAFGPDMIFISAGFDGHKDDVLGGCAAVGNSSIPAGYTEEDYVWATQEILCLASKHCNNRVISVLEGGYDVREETNALAKCVHAHIDAIVTFNPDVKTEKLESTLMVDGAGADWMGGKSDDIKHSSNPVQSAAGAQQESDKEHDGGVATVSSSLDETLEPSSNKVEDVMEVDEGLELSTIQNANEVPMIKTTFALVDGPTVPEQQLCVKLEEKSLLFEIETTKGEQGSTLFSI